MGELFQRREGRLDGNQNCHDSKLWRLLFIARKKNNLDQTNTILQTCIELQFNTVVNDSVFILI